MKKVTTVFTAIALFCASAVFALEPETVSSEVKAVFSKDFAKAKNISWRKSGDFYYAQFTLNDKNVNAVYTEKGELTGTSRVITIEELPLNISRAILKEYDTYKIGKDITEISFEGITSYYFTAENDKQTLTVKVDGSANFQVQGKVKKQVRG